MTTELIENISPTQKLVDAAALEVSLLKGPLARFMRDFIFLFTLKKWWAYGLFSQVSNEPNHFKAERETQQKALLMFFRSVSPVIQSGGGCYGC